jgi:hypothetical protein
MQHIPSRDTNRFSDSEEIPRILWNPKVHSPMQNSPIPVPVSSQINEVYVAYLTSRRPISILSFHPRLCLISGLFLSGFPTKILHPPLLSPYLLYPLAILLFLM